MLSRIINGYCTLLNYLIAAMLALMVVLVFGNVVLRYAFNSGISLSDELSRWLFVWLTFLGAAVALNDRAHLGTDMLVSRLGPKGRKLCLGLAYIAMLVVCGLVLQGAWAQMLINWDTPSAVMEVTVAAFYASGVVFSVLSGAILLRDFARLVSGRMGDDELLMVQETEERAHTSTTSQ